MLNYFILLILIIVSSLNLFGNSLADTSKLTTMPNDTSKCTLLNKISEQFKDYNAKTGLDYAKQSLVLSKSLNFKKGIAGAYKALGINYWRSGAFDAALDNYMMSVPLFEEINDKISVIKIYNNIALIYLTKSELAKAEENLNFALKLAKDFKEKREISRIQHNLALVYSETNRKELALESFFSSLKLAYEINDSVLIGFNQCFIGRAYTYQKDFKNAKKYLELSLKTYKALNNPNNIAMVYNYLAELYKNQNYYPKALDYAKNGYELGENIGNIFMKAEASKIMYEIYKEINDYDKALKYLGLFYELSDTLRKETNLLEFAQKEAKFEYERNLKELNYEKDKEIYKNKILAITFIAIALVLGVAILIVFVFFKQKEKANKQLIEINNRITTLNKELENLNATKDKFFSIISHDLKNPIGSFNTSLTYFANNFSILSKEEIEEMIILLKESSDNLYNLLINLLDWSRCQRGVIKCEKVEINLNIVFNNIINLFEQNAKQKQIILFNNLKEDIFAIADFSMLNTVLRNLISNAIKFSNMNGIIELNADIKDDLVVISVKDNGIGISKEASENLFNLASNKSTLGTSGESGTGLGLILCKEFIEKNDGKIWVESQEGKGTTFYFTLKLANKT